MPLEIKMVVGEFGTLDVKADAMDPSIVDLAKTFVSALPASGRDDAQTAEQLRAITEQARGQRVALTDAVTTHQPPQPEDSAPKQPVA